MAWYWWAILRYAIMMNKNMIAKGIIYCRVSSQEQVQGTSLEGQKEACLRYAEEKGIGVDKIFVEKGESATAANRTELIKTLDYCRDNSGNIAAFIVWKLDRFARNTTDHYGLQAQLMKYGTVLHSVAEPMISEGPVGKVLEAVLAGFAQFENDIRKQRCEGGMQRRIAEGIWPWQPPIGYTHSKKRLDRRKTHPDELDLERFSLIQRGLKEYTTGNYSIIALTDFLNKIGLRTRTNKAVFKQLVDKMLQNKFYAGILNNPWTGEEYPGLHQPMITLEEFEQIQLIKSGRSLNRGVLRQYPHPDFPLRQFIKCSCGHNYTGSWQTGRNKRYAYYRCDNKKCGNYGLNIRKDDLETKFFNFLKKITPTKKFLDLLKITVVHDWNEQRLSSKTEGKHYETELKKLETQKAELLQLRINKELTPEEFKKERTTIENKVAGLRISKNESNTNEFDMEIAVSYAVQYMADLGRQWLDTIETKQKQRFQYLVLPEGIIYHRETQTFGTAVLSPLLSLSEAYKTSPSDFVAGGGLEPPTFGL